MRALSYNEAADPATRHRPGTSSASCNQWFSQGEGRSPCSHTCSSGVMMYSVSSPFILPAFSTAPSQLLVLRRAGSGT